MNVSSGPSCLHSGGGEYERIQTDEILELIDCQTENIYFMEPLQELFV